jgi:glycosyltransferase involved in cell wall biosynthesis
VTPHILHVFSTFVAGGPQVRAVQIFNALGAAYRHTVMATDARYDAAELIVPGTPVTCVPPPPGKGSVHYALRLRREIAKFGPDLVVTYNWGAIDAVVAAKSLRLPLIHIEDGFGDDEATGQKRRRVWARRILLRGARRVVAPSHTLIRLMRELWRLPESKLLHIPNGIDPGRFVPRLRSGPDVVVGTVGHLRREKRQDRLIEACAAVSSSIPVRLLIAGDGPERQRLESLSARIGCPVQFLGHRPGVEAVYPEMDIFALSSSTEQMPISVLEAMAAGLPVLSTDVGDVRQMVSEENRPFVVGEPDYAQALARLVSDRTLRASVGAANRDHVVRAYSLEVMCARYDRLFRDAAG